MWALGEEITVWTIARGDSEPGAVVLEYPIELETVLRMPHEERLEREDWG